MKKRKTAGELSLKASGDTTKYQSLEVGHALTDDIPQQLILCAQRHREIFDEKEYCVGYVIAGDPLIHNVMRRKFFAFLYLPSPRPNQAVFLYNKDKDQIVKRLWVLPNAWTMACLSEMGAVDEKFKTMQVWSKAFYAGKFWNYIRKQHGIKMLSEIEYLKANREKLIQAGCKEFPPDSADPFDFTKISSYKVEDPNNAVLEKDLFKATRQAQNGNRSITL